MRSIWEEVEKEVPGFETEYFDVDIAPDKASEYGIEKIPVFVFLDKEGKELERLSGACNKADLVEKTKELLDK